MCDDAVRFVLVSQDQLDTDAREGPRGRAAPSDEAVLVAGHVLRRGSAESFQHTLTITFTVRGPEASRRFITDHVLVFRADPEASEESRKPEKLRNTEGYGGPDGTDGWFLVQRYEWPGGTSFTVKYGNRELGILAQERVTLL